jgi:formate dehydrogenase
MRTERTYCRVCEAACGLEADIDGDGRPLRLRPDREHPVSKGFACAKGTRFAETATHPDRLLYPQRRDDAGALRRVTWKEALAESGAKLKAIRDRHGPHAVGAYFGNPLAFNAFGAVAMPLFMKALGTRNVYSAGSQDCNNKFTVAQLVHGSPLLQPIPDLAHAELVLLFGTNPAVSQSSFVHLEGGSALFNALKAKGTQMVWIDPRRSESAARWGEHLAIRPGSDVYLILGLLHLLGDMHAPGPHVEGLEPLLAQAAWYPPERVAALTGIPAAAVVHLAGRIRASQATAFHLSVGVNQSGFGAAAYLALQALMVVTGNFDKRGGALVHPLGLRFADLARALKIGTETAYSRIGKYPSNLDTLPGGILADEILTPGDEQVRALVVIAGDPLRSMPDAKRLREAFRALEWLVVIDLFETATAREADVLLPATSWLERFDVATTTALFHTSPLLQFAPAVAKAPGETRHEAAILVDLARAIGGKVGRGMLPVRALMATDAVKLPALYARLFAGATQPLGSRPGYGIRVSTPVPGAYLGRGPRTPGHKLRFWDATVAAEFARVRAAAGTGTGAGEGSDPATSGGGFLLLGRRRRLGHNAWLQGAVHDGDPEAVAWLNPADAAALGLPVKGGAIRIANATGALAVRAVGKDGVLRRTVVLPHGIPGLNFNDLVPTGAESIERLTGMSRMTGIAVQVELVGLAEGAKRRRGEGANSEEEIA